MQALVWLSLVCTICCVPLQLQFDVTAYDTIQHLKLKFVQCKMAAVRRSNRSTSAATINMRDNSDESDGWEDSDDDQPKTASAGAKRKAPRGEQNTDPNSAPAARKRQRTAAARADLHDLTLLEIVMKHSNSIDNAVKEWIERYRSNRAAAAAELMTLLVKVGGCDAELTEEDVEGGEVDQLAARLTNTVVQEGGVDVLHNNRTGRMLAEHYRVFWDKALRQLAAADLLFDDFELNDKLCRLVTALSISVVRGFRYAATLTAAQLISTWISISAGLTESRELAKFQLDAEEKKKKPSREVVASLKRTVERCHTRVEDLRNFRSVTFTGVFSHRFRDVSDEIRAIVVESIGSWVVVLPTEFLADTYLKYLAWALSDRSALVRGKALAALDRLYSNRWAGHGSVAWLFCRHCWLSHLASLWPVVVNVCVMIAKHRGSTVSSLSKIECEVSIIMSSLFLMVMSYYQRSTR
eukprot:GHUV01014877.1.p1 GENE.GHUV01014877.1~~GHUV01014877.1.p1  ORF type:complete len:467 (+),score=119.45 GHUV01014877.1:76-1476(+)